MNSPRRGLLIALEGGEACGKTTQARRLAHRLGAVLTREPGGTQIGESIRKILLDHDSAALVPRAEALLMAAARAQHVAEVIVPTLDSGTHVVTDRFTGSSLAYQGFGRGLELDELRSLSQFACDGLDADLVVLLAVPSDQAQQRLGKPSDRLEAAGHPFHARVLEGFASLARDDSDKWVVIDGMGTPDEVQARVWSAVCDRIAKIHSDPSTPSWSPS